jgi:hypothetical protein
MSIIVQLLVNSYEEIASRNKIDNLLHEKIDIDRAIADPITGIGPAELAVLKIAGSGHSAASGCKELGISRWKFRKVFVKACEKIAVRLGWEYSDTCFVLGLRSKTRTSSLDLRKLEEGLQRYNG